MKGAPNPSRILKRGGMWAKTGSINKRNLNEQKVGKDGLQGKRK